MVAYLTMTLIASLLLRLLEKAMDGSSNYNLVAVDQLVTAAGTYNHPGKGSPSDERNPEAVKSMMREEVRRQAEQEAARQKGKVATVRRENTNSDQRGDL
jgi:hypothetical protein